MPKMLFFPNTYEKSRKVILFCLLSIILGLGHNQQTRAESPTFNSKSRCARALLHLFNESKSWPPSEDLKQKLWGPLFEAYEELWTIQIRAAIRRSRERGLTVRVDQAILQDSFGDSFNDALESALRNFDPERENSEFSKYFITTMARKADEALADYLQGSTSSSGLVRITEAGQLFTARGTENTALQHLTAPGPSVTDVIMRQDFIENFLFARNVETGEFLSRLTEREARVVKMRFMEDLTLEEIGQELEPKLSGARVRQILNNGINKLHSYVDSKFKANYFDPDIVPDAEEPLGWLID